MFKVLIVDDEPFICKALSKFLKVKGYYVVSANNNGQALEAYKREQPDLVLLDVWMPGRDGIETLKDLKALDPRAKVLMVTAHHEDGLDEKALAEGAFDYIVKPVEADFLELCLETMAICG